jgi:hypothetical protein
MVHDAYVTNETTEWIVVRVLVRSQGVDPHRETDHVDIPCKLTMTFGELEKSVRKIHRLALKEFEDFLFYECANWEDGRRVGRGDDVQNCIPRCTSRCVGDLKELGCRDPSDMCGALYLHHGQWLRIRRLRRIGIVVLGCIEDEGDYFTKFRHAVCMAGSPMALVKSYIDSAAATSQFEEFVRETNVTISSDTAFSSYSRCSGKELM